MRKALVVLTLLAGAAAAGDFQTGTAEGHDFAASQKGYVKGLAEGQDSKASLYGGSSTVSADLHPCNQLNAQGQKTCGGEAIIPGDNPDQYYGMSKAQLEDNARVKASSDPTAQYMFDSHNTRPEFDVRRDDPLFKHQDANQSKMVNLSETYTGCKQIAYGGVVTTTEDKQCKKYGTAVYKETTCNRALQVTCSNANAGQPRPYVLSEFNVGGAYMPKSVSGNTFSFGTTYNNRGQNCNGYTTTITFEVDDVNNILEFAALYYVWDDRIDVWINGVKIFRAVGGNVGLNAPESTGFRGIVRCEFGSVYSRSTNDNLKPHLKNGTNTITILNKVGGEGNAFMQFRVQRKWGCAEVESSTLSCPESFDMAGASLLNKTCSSGAATRVIGGANVTRSCWGWNETYKWESLPSYAEDSMCQSYRDQGCVPKASVCNATSPSGWCQDATLTFTCSNEAPEKTMEVCGDTLVCPDGHCYDSYKEPVQDSTQDFMKAASYLAAMEDMKNEFNPDEVTVWKGEFKECSVNETLIGSDACCTGGTGTINRLGKSCNATEEYIAQARDDERASFVRRWKECTQEVLGVCVNELTHYEFCVWPSKLARIVQDQGRPMLGQVVDNPCPGFKLQNPNEFAGIDWSRIDLSDYYEDVQAKYNATAKPSPDGLTSQMQQSNTALQDELTQKMQQYYGQ